MTGNNGFSYKLIEGGFYANPTVKESEKMENEKLDMLGLSRADILAVRKSCVEEMIRQQKELLKDRVMLLLGGSMDKNLETKTTGNVAFLERWLKEIDTEIDNL